jgi:hypothetical protein
MDPKIARNQKYDNHYANDRKDVHFAHSQSMMAAHDVARTPCIRGYCSKSFRHTSHGSTKTRQVQAVVIATGYIPNIRLLRK